MSTEIERERMVWNMASFKGVACISHKSRTLAEVRRVWIPLLCYTYLVSTSTAFMQPLRTSSSLYPARSIFIRTSMECFDRNRGPRRVVSKRESCYSTRVAYKTIRGQPRACASELYVNVIQAQNDQQDHHIRAHSHGIMGAEITIPLKIDEVKRSSEKERIIPVKDHGGHDGGGGVGGGGRGGDGEGEGDGAGDGGGGGGVNEADVVATRRPEDGISHKVKKAIKKGKIPKECSAAYANLLGSPAMALLCKSDGWRARLLGDPTFMTKLWIELVTGTAAQAIAEYQKRGKKFLLELDFVVADTLTSLFATFAAIWLSCPTVVVKASKRGAVKAGGALQNFLRSCPSNAFQKMSKSAAGMGASQSYTMYQRGAALLIPMPKLFVIGFGATLGGYGLIAALEIINKKRVGQVDAADVPLEGANASGLPVMGAGLAIGAFLAVSSNLRYQFIAGAVEQRAFANMRPSISSLASMVVRSGNLYVGSLTIVDWLRFLGVQS